MGEIFTVFFLCFISSRIDCHNNYRRKRFANKAQRQEKRWIEEKSSMARISAHSGWWVVCVCLCVSGVSVGNDFQCNRHIFVSDFKYSAGMNSRPLFIIWHRRRSRLSLLRQASIVMMRGSVSGPCLQCLSYSKWQLKPTFNAEQTRKKSRKSRKLCLRFFPFCSLVLFTRKPLWVWARVWANGPLFQWTLFLIYVISIKSRFMNAEQSGRRNENARFEPRRTYL